MAHRISHSFEWQISIKEYMFKKVNHIAEAVETYEIKPTHTDLNKKQQNRKLASSHGEKHWLMPSLPFLYLIVSLKTRLFGKAFAVYDTQETNTQFCSLLSSVSKQNKWEETAPRSETNGAGSETPFARACLQVLPTPTEWNRCQHYSWISSNNSTCSTRLRLCCLPKLSCI